MKKYIVFIIFFITGALIVQQNRTGYLNYLYRPEQPIIKKIDIENLVDMLYGKNGANLEANHLVFIQELLTAILQLSEKQQQTLAYSAIQLLQAQQEEESKLENLIRSYRINYLQRFIQPCKNLENIDPAIQTIAEQIITYIAIEQKYILSKQKSKFIFLQAIAHRKKAEENTSHTNSTSIHQLPQIINFWAIPASEKIIDTYSSSDSVETQNYAFVRDLLFEMTIAVLAQQGASLANARITSQGALLAQKIAKDSQTIQANMQRFQSSAQKEQQAELQVTMTAFGNAQKDLQQDMQQASAISNLELDYLYKNISVEQPQQNYIFNQIQFDQIFTLGTMLTPKGPLWKNPFAVGDWEYEKSSNSFWQYQSSPMMKHTTDSSGKKTTSSLQAENNAIYAEYFTSASEYIIAGSITLHRADYPFFAGIIFNKARWISGDFEAIRKCRMIGIYGNSIDDVGVYFAQQYTMNDEQMEANPDDDPIQTPLQQIINKKVEKKINLPGQAFTNLQNSPLTFNFEIRNSPTTLTLKLWVDNNPSITIHINNLDPAIYMYHGIGFICPGAVAEFKLLQPQDFIFTSQAISNYKD